MILTYKLYIDNYIYKIFAHKVIYNHTIYIECFNFLNRANKILWLLKPKHFDY